jgi:hypothetical protein
LGDAVCSFQLVHPETDAVVLQFGKVINPGVRPTRHCDASVCRRG